MPDHIAAARVAADFVQHTVPRYAAVVGVLDETDRHSAAIRAVCDNLEHEVKDWAESDTRIREACRAVLGDVVDGDPECVPSMAELCERVCEELKAARERIAALESRVKPINWPFVEKPKVSGTLASDRVDLHGGE